MTSSECVYGDDDQSHLRSCRKVNRRRTVAQATVGGNRYLIRVQITFRRHFFIRSTASSYPHCNLIGSVLNDQEEIYINLCS